jgi:uncharacterized protein with von Willebrand factor type A (vWA) domain
VPDRTQPFTGVLVGFARELRANRLTIGTGDLLTYCSAMTPLDPTDLVDLYWAGRVTLVNRGEDIATYDKVFRDYFLGENDKAARTLMLPATAAAQATAELIMAGNPDAPPGDEEKPLLGLMASDVDALKHRSFAACTPQELAALRRIIARIRLTPPRRRTRRTRPAKTGRVPDMRKTIRDSLRVHGEPTRLSFKERRTRLRPLILILDVSGSMADYSRHLLQFAHSAKHAAARVEVFCFGTRLTRITKALELRSPDAALENASERVVDWDGGTRIGGSLSTFVKEHKALCRGSVVIICSDGLDRGDPEVLANAMERLARLTYRVVWLNPHKGDNHDFQPNTLGMMVVAPHIDHLLSCHDLASLEHMAQMLPTLR